MLGAAWAPCRGRRGRGRAGYPGAEVPEAAVGRAAPRRRRVRGSCGVPAPRSRGGRPRAGPEETPGPRRRRTARSRVADAAAVRCGSCRDAAPRAPRLPPRRTFGRAVRLDPSSREWTWPQGSRAAAGGGVGAASGREPVSGPGPCARAPPRPCVTCRCACGVVASRAFPAGETAPAARRASRVSGQQRAPVHASGRGPAAAEQPRPPRPPCRAMVLRAPRPRGPVRESPDVPGRASPGRVAFRAEPRKGLGPPSRPRRLGGAVAACPAACGGPVDRGNAVFPGAPPRLL